MHIFSLKALALSLALIGLSGCVLTDIDGTVIPASKQTLKSEFSERNFTASNGTKLAVRFYYPDIPQGVKVPLIVYLHGAGQNGTDNERQLDDSVGCLYSFSYDRNEYKSFILVPQCPAGVYWRDDDVLESIVELIEEVSNNPFIDKDRIYITGFSMGGDATWKIGLVYPEMVSTLVPVCGGPLASMEPDIPNVSSAMADLNIWAFNNFDDGVVRPTYSKRIMATLWDIAPSESLNFTESVSGGHSPKQVYRNRDVLIWMLSTKRSNKRK